MSLKDYQKKRTFRKTEEPKGKFHKKDEQLIFVIQKHAASRLHYDLRLEVNGVLKSWAIPKGPSLNPADKRLAIKVEDHPHEYKDFEGTIPEGNYGAGTVMIWDQGTYSVDDLDSVESEKFLSRGLTKGAVHFTLHGHKLQGEFALIKLKNRSADEWLLLKKKDPFSSSEDITKKDRSVISKRSLAQISGPIDKTDFFSLLEHARRKKMPHKIKPMLCTLISAPFDDKEWIFEIKWDGFRAIAEVNQTQIAFYSRTFHSFSEGFPDIVEALKELKIQAIFDGEIVALDKKGRPHFQELQNFQSNLSKKGFALGYYIFDLLYYEGHDLRQLPLIERKQILEQVLKLKDHSLLKYSDHVEEMGNKFFTACAKQNLEGIVGKYKWSAYQEGYRGKEWVKIKKHERQEAIICGFTAPQRGRKFFGALLLGVYKDHQLHFIGHCGGGFSEAEACRSEKTSRASCAKKMSFCLSS